MGAKIVYKNYALIDKNNTVPSSQDLNTFACLDDLRYNNKPARLASFEEQYMRSDVGYPFYCMGEECCEVLGYVSASMCDGAGVYNQDNPPAVKISMPKDADGNSVPATSDGITLYFSPLEEEYATEVLLRWNVKNLDGGADKTVEETFYPDGNVFFCPKQVENYTCVDVVFKKWSFGNRWARLYRIDYGHEIVYEENAVFSVSVNESANLVAEQIEVNTSNVVLLTDSDETFQKQQDFEIWHNDKLIAKHYVKELKIQGRRISITGHDMLSKLDNLKMPAHESYYTRTFEDWVDNIIWGANDQEIQKIFKDWDASAEPLKGIRLSCAFEDGVTKREALTRLCLAAGAYVDTTATIDGQNGIIIKSTQATLHAQRTDMPHEDDESAETKIIPETLVFSGDSTEIKEPYQSLTIKYKNSSGDEKVLPPIVNTTHPDSTAKKEFDLKTISAEHYPELRDLYAQYYFHSEFYQAKAVIEKEIGIGDRILINGKDAFVIQRTLNLDGDKIIADGTYKLVEER